MIGRVLLQGGDEFTEPCQAMDRAYLERVDPGVVLIAPLACVSGAAYRAAGANGREYLEALGYDDVSVAAEPGVQLDRVVRSIVQARTVVIPGGSPSLIHRRVVGTAVGGALRAHIARGGTIIGASAGAMVLGGRMLVPGVDDSLHRALGVLRETIVLPHFDDARAAVVDGVRAQAPADATVLGIPSCSGVLIEDAGTVGLGIADCSRYAPDGTRSVVPRG